MKDNDLDLLLSEYRSQKPSELQVQKWKSAVRREIASQKNSNKNLWMQLVAATLVGFIVGALAFKTSKQEDIIFQNFAQNDENNATLEYVFTKTN